VHDLLGRALLDDVTCTSTGEVTPVIVVSDNGPCDNGPCYRETASCATSRRGRSSHTCAPAAALTADHGVIERYHGAIQIEDLWRDLPAGRRDDDPRRSVRQLDNHVRPHETLAGARLIERYLADPTRRSR